MRVKALKELFSKELIQERVECIARRLNADYAGQDVVFVCVLKGAFMFFSDLVKHLDFHPEIDFVRLSSYGEGDASSGTVEFSKDVDVPLAGKHVVIVEDIVDTGNSMRFLRERFLERDVKSLRIVALVDKVERRSGPVQVDYSGFFLSSGFIVGYGLDYAEQYRELPSVYTVELEE